MSNKEFPSKKHTQKKGSRSRKVIVLGGSGFVGSQVVPLLISRGYMPVIIDLNTPKYETSAHAIVADTRNNWNEEISNQDRHTLTHPLAYINLAGVSIGGKFTPERKRLIHDSRVETTRRMGEFFEEQMYRPEVLVQASAVGYYGDAHDTILNESSKKGKGFLSDVVSAWEQEARHIEKHYGVRTVILRQGHIIGTGGYLARLLPIYRKGLGGALGDGQQFLPWIHADDLIEYYLESIQNERIRGVYNMISGEAVRQKYFSQQLARVLKKPHFLRIPVWAMRMMYGELADEMVKSQRINPSRIDEFEYELVLNNVTEAIEYSIE